MTSWPKGRPLCEDVGAAGRIGVLRRRFRPSRRRRLRGRSRPIGASGRLRRPGIRPDSLRRCVPRRAPRGPFGSPPLPPLRHAAPREAHAPAAARHGAGRAAGPSRLRRRHLPHRVRRLRAARPGRPAPARCGGHGDRASGGLRHRARPAALRRAAVQPLPGVPRPGARARPRVRGPAAPGAREAGGPRQGRSRVARHVRCGASGGVLRAHPVAGRYRARRLGGHDGVHQPPLSSAGRLGSGIVRAGGRRRAPRGVEGQREHGARRARPGRRYERVRAGQPARLGRDAPVRPRRGPRARARRAHGRPGARRAAPQRRHRAAHGAGGGYRGRVRRRPCCWRLPRSWRRERSMQAPPCWQPSRSCRLSARSSPLPTWGPRSSRRWLRARASSTFWTSARRPTRCPTAWTSAPSTVRPRGAWTSPTAACACSSRWT